MSADFRIRPDDGNTVPIITLSAAENWKHQDFGVVKLNFAKRARSGLVVVYASIPDVPRGMEGRAVALWILAHPWRPLAAVRMVSAFVKMKSRLRPAVRPEGEAP